MKWDLTWAGRDENAPPSRKSNNQFVKKFLISFIVLSRWLSRSGFHVNNSYYIFIFVSAVFQGKTYFSPCFSVSIVTFEYVNGVWVQYYCLVCLSRMLMASGARMLLC